MDGWAWAWSVDGDGKRNRRGLEIGEEAFGFGLSTRVIIDL